MTPSPRSKALSGAPELEFCPWHNSAPQRRTPLKSAFGDLGGGLAGLAADFRLVLVFLVLLAVGATVYARRLDRRRAPRLGSSSDAEVHLLTVCNGLTQAGDLLALVRSALGGATLPYRVRLWVLVPAGSYPLWWAQLQVWGRRPWLSGGLRSCADRVCLVAGPGLAQVHQRTGRVGQGVGYPLLLRKLLAATGERDGPAVLLGAPGTFELARGWDQQARRLPPGRLAAVGHSFRLQAASADPAADLANQLGDFEFQEASQTSGGLMQMITSGIQNFRRGRSPALAGLALDGGLVHPEACAAASLAGLRSALLDPPEADVRAVCTAPMALLNSENRRNPLAGPSVVRLARRMSDNPFLQKEMEEYGQDPASMDGAINMLEFTNGSDAEEVRRRRLATVRDTRCCARATALDLVWVNAALHRVFRQEPGASRLAEVGAPAFVDAGRGAIPARVAGPLLRRALPGQPAGARPGANQARLAIAMFAAGSV